MKKRFGTLVLALILACSLAIPAGASCTTKEREVISGVKVSQHSDGYITIKEIDRSDYLEKTTLSSDNVDYDAIRKELAAIGISQQTIDDMEDWYLLEYAQSSSIVYSSGYYKIDSSGTATSISEQAALQGVAMAKEKLSAEDETAQTNISPIQDENDFLRLELVINFFPGKNGLFSHRSEATWLIPPTNLRGNDYIGSSAQLSAIIDSTRAGWAKYKKNSHDTAGGIISTTEETYNFTNKNFQNADKRPKYRGGLRRPFSLSKSLAAVVVTP